MKKTFMRLKKWGQKQAEILDKQAFAAWGLGTDLMMIILMILSFILFLVPAGLSLFALVLLFSLPVTHGISVIVAPVFVCLLSFVFFFGLMMFSWILTVKVALKVWFRFRPMEIG